MSEDKELTPEELKAKLEETQAQLKRVNAESAERRKKLEGFEAEKEALKQKGLSETEKLQAEIKAGREETKALKENLQAQRVRAAIWSETVNLGFANPDDAIALLDLSEVTETDGKVTGFEKSLKALAESGRLPMADQKKGDGLGTPAGKGKPTGDKADEAPITIRL